MMENRSFDHYFGWHPDADGRNEGLTYPGSRRQPAPDLPPDPRLPGLRPSRPRPRLGRAGASSGTGGKNDRFVFGQRGGHRKRRVRDRLLPEGGPRLHPARRRRVHALRPLVLLDHGVDLPQPPLPVGSPERRAEVEPAAAGDRGTPTRLHLGDDLRPRRGERGELSATTTPTFRSPALYGQRGHRLDEADLRLLHPGRHRDPSQHLLRRPARSAMVAVATASPPTSTRTGTSASARRSCPTSSTRSWSRRSTPSAGALFINYDEWGGFFDHVPPPFVPDDRRNLNDIDNDWGFTGFRIPGVAISPYTRKGGVSHMPVTHESILKLISYKFGLGHLNKRHRYAPTSAAASTSSGGTSTRRSIPDSTSSWRLRPPRARRSGFASRRAEAARPRRNWRPPATSTGSASR